MRVREDYRTLTGPEKAAILMLSIGEEHASRLFALMDDAEITELSQTMSNLGTVHSTIIERLFAEFSDQVSPAGSSIATFDSTDPQTVAVALSKINPEHRARVLAQLPEALATDVIMRMLRMGAVQKDIADDIDNVPQALANRDRATETRFSPALDARSRDSAERVTAMTFTFEDLGRLDPASVQTLLRGIDRSKLAIALKGASEPLRELFFANMSERGRKLLREEIQALGPVKLRDVDEAQMYMVSTAKELSAKDEIVSADARGDDELIY